MVSGEGSCRRIFLSLAVLQCYALGVVNMLRTSLEEAPPRGKTSIAGDSYYQRLETPLGRMWVLADDAFLRVLEFAEVNEADEPAVHPEKFKIAGLRFEENLLITHIKKELKLYFEGEPCRFQTPVKPVGTPFQERVWDVLKTIPTAQTGSYADVAKAIGQPKACRAVAQAIGRNPIAIVIPCHRVIGSSGSLTGYAGGLWRKKRLLALEQTAFREI
jgi:AraC family transcriptional regulator, regulatory protein of adaptative response / methylated-DNA-[protein]-cysteine methyltransferase